MSDNSVEKKSMSYTIKGMDCQSCRMEIENAVCTISGTSNVSLNYTAERLSLQIDTDKTDSSAIEKLVEKLGYEIFNENEKSLKDNESFRWWQSRKGRTVIFSVLALAIASLFSLIFPDKSDIFFAVVALATLLPIAKKMLSSFQVGNIFSIELLVVVAVVGAIVISEAAEASIVVVLFSIGELLENIAAEKAREGVRALAGLVPKIAFLVVGNKTTEVPAEDLKMGQIIEIRPGGRVSADGEIIDGNTSIDESSVTGESIPVTRGVGDTVYAGSLNADGVIRVEVTKSASDNMIARIIHLVEEAEESKAPTARFIDEFSKYYTPGILFVSFLIAIIPPLFFGGVWDEWIYKGLAILLIGCPCALVLSVPAAITSGIASGAKRGLLIKGGAILEAVGKVRAFAFDKTGTLTEGVPKVTDIVSFDGDENKLMSLAAAVEASSMHPLAKAIVLETKTKEITIPIAKDGEALQGRGVSAYVEKSHIIVASPRYADEISSISKEYMLQINQLEKDGKTVAVVVVDKNTIGFIALRDELRDDAKLAMEELKELGISAIMLTGDNKRTGEALAKSLNIKVVAELMPEDKVKEIKALKEKYQGGIAMVGDGINDAPALALADVGIAMGGGTDVALETADAALLHETVRDVPALVRLSRATLANIKQNITVALGLKAIFFITTLFGLTNLWMAILADTGATILVTMNALRLLSFKPR